MKLLDFRCISMSFPGLAAANVNGSTIHSTLNISIL